MPAERDCGEFSPAGAEEMEVSMTIMHFTCGWGAWIGRWAFGQCFANASFIGSCNALRAYVARRILSNVGILERLTRRARATQERSGRGMLQELSGDG